MTGPSSHDVTILLDQARDGDPSAFDRLLPLVYDELHRLAHRQRNRQRASETLNTTALVHEAYEKLARQRDRAGDEARLGWNDRAHFFRVAAKAMRQILVDHARARRAQKRGGDDVPIALDAVPLAAEERADEILALDEALTCLAGLDARQAEVVELRYFVGLTIEEAAEVLGLSPATVKREWTAARAWLHRAMTAPP